MSSQGSPIITTGRPPSISMQSAYEGDSVTTPLLPSPERVWDGRWKVVLGFSIAGVTSTVVLRAMAEKIFDGPAPQAEVLLSTTMGACARTVARAYFSLKNQLSLFKESESYGVLTTYLFPRELLYNTDAMGGASAQELAARILTTFILAIAGGVVVSEIDRIFYSSAAEVFPVSEPRQTPLRMTGHDLSNRMVACLTLSEILGGISLVVVDNYIEGGVLFPHAKNGGLFLIGDGAARGAGRLFKIWKEKQQRDLPTEEAVWIENISSSEVWAARRRHLAHTSGNFLIGILMSLFNYDSNKYAWVLTLVASIRQLVSESAAETFVKYPPENDRGRASCAKITYFVLLTLIFSGWFAWAMATNKYPGAYFCLPLTFVSAIGTGVLTTLVKRKFNRNPNTQTPLMNRVRFLFVKLIFPCILIIYLLKFFDLTDTELKKASWGQIGGSSGASIALGTVIGNAAVDPQGINPALQVLLGAFTTTAWNS